MDDEEDRDGCLDKALYQLFGAGMVLLLAFILSSCAAPMGAEDDVSGAVGMILPCFMLAAILIAFAILAGHGNDD